MISLKAKNYILLGYDGKLIIKGSSLRSRRDERVFRDFIESAASLLVEGHIEAVSRLYHEVGRRILDGDISVFDFARQESITEKTFESPNLKRLARAVEGYNIGDRVAVYQRTDGNLAVAEAYQRDEDKDYLLRRLHDTALRFRELYSPEVFEPLFPLLRSEGRTKSSEQVQLSLFE
jgi:hypothetical protein